MLTLPTAKLLAELYELEDIKTVEHGRDNHVAVLNGRDTIPFILDRYKMMAKAKEFIFKSGYSVSTVKIKKDGKDFWVTDINLDSGKHMKVSLFGTHGESHESEGVFKMAEWVRCKNNGEGYDET